MFITEEEHEKTNLLLESGQWSASCCDQQHTACDVIYNKQSNLTEYITKCPGRHLNTLLGFLIIYMDLWMCLILGSIPLLYPMPRPETALTLLSELDYLGLALHYETVISWLLKQLSNECRGVEPWVGLTQQSSSAKELKRKNTTTTAGILNITQHCVLSLCSEQSPVKHTSASRITQWKQCKT